MGSHEVKPNSQAVSVFCLKHVVDFMRTAGSGECARACLPAPCYATISIVTAQSSKRALSTTRPVDAKA